MDFKTEAVFIGDNEFHIRELSARQRQEIFKLFKNDADPIEIQAKYIQMACEEFKDKSPDDILDIPGSVFSELSESIIEISGLSDNAQEEAEKNS